MKIDLHTRGTKSGRERDYSADVIISREKNEKKDRERERERERRMEKGPRRKRIKNEVDIGDGEEKTVSPRSGFLNYLFSGVAGP